MILLPCCGTDARMSGSRFMVVGLWYMYSTVGFPAKKAPLAGVARGRLDNYTQSKNGLAGAKSS